MQSFTHLSKKIRAAHLQLEHPKVASVAVIWNNHLLMMKRRDNGKWTLPGGHFEPGETPHEAAIRELREETGIRAWALYKLGWKTVDKFSGGKVEVHAYRLETPKQLPTAALDPDAEAVEFKWVPFRGIRGTANELRPENLHSPKNFVLECLGIQ